MNLPVDIADLVWNYDTRSLDPQQSSEVVVRSVLRLGSWDQIMWTFSFYGRDTVRQIIERDYFGARSLPVSVRVFWGNVFWPDSPPPEIADPMERWRPTRSVQMEASAEVQVRIQRAVETSGLSQKAFASLLGTSQPRLSSYLSGKVMPSAKLLVQAERIAKGLGPVLQS
jgi:predicted XRE-type DNA-binding protein